MQLPRDDAERYEYQQDVDVVAGQCAPDHATDVSGVRLPFRFLFAAGAQQGGGLAVRAVGGTGHVAVSVIVEAFGATVTMQLGP